VSTRPLDVKRQATGTHICPTEASMEQVTPTWSRTQHGFRETVWTRGLILFSASMDAIFANQEAIRILCFPNDAPQACHIRSLICDRLPKKLFTPISSNGQAIEIVSGRRRYICTSHALEGATIAKTVAVLMERPLSHEMAVYRVAKQFHLSAREHDAMQHLARGLSTKEIAHEMGISPNTAKAFLRSAMLKAGVRNRRLLLQRVMAAVSSVEPS